MKRFFYVYGLVSKADAPIHHTSITDHLSARLRDHDRRPLLAYDEQEPWRIETAVAFRSEAKAHAFENYLKSGSGREFAHRHF
jgi:putative endonuclease